MPPARLPRGATAHSGGVRGSARRRGDPELAREAAAAGVNPRLVTGPNRDAISFLSAAQAHGVDAVRMLEQAHGNADEAWGAVGRQRQPEVKAATLCRRDALPS